MSSSTNYFNDLPPNYSSNSSSGSGDFSKNKINSTGTIVKLSSNSSDEHLMKVRDFNGDTNYHRGDINNYLPNNNLCDITSASTFCSSNRDEMNCIASAISGSDERKIDDDNNEEEETKESDFCSIQEYTSSVNEENSSTTDSQATEAQSSDSYNTNPSSLDDKSSTFQDAELQLSSTGSNYLNNGLLKKTSNSRRKKIGSSSSGPGRGRPRKALVAMYQSQISGDKNTIKIRIKKSNLTTHVQLTPNKKKSGRRKKHKMNSDASDASDTERKVKRSRAGGGDSIGGGDNNVSSTQEEPLEQSPWGCPLRMPSVILEKIFNDVCAQDGCLPTLVKLCKVCRLWRDVSLLPQLWRKADLNYVREKDRTDLRIHWLILNRLTHCEDLNLGEWKVRDIQAVLEALCEHSPRLHGLNLSGWKGLNADNLKYLTNEAKKLERLDLSSINSTSAINAQPLVGLSHAMNSRLTHLVLAHNKIAGFTQIIAAIAANCPNLQLLDISNIRTFAHNTALLHVEKLQTGCKKLRVLRITNSQIWLAPASLPEQVASPGFPELEELSLAGLEEDQTTTSRSMDDDGIERLLKNSTKLRLLDVRGCSRLTDSGLVRVPAWDLEHLFLSACYITRLQNSGLELIVQKWSHSLLEVDLAWSTATESIDAAVMALAERGSESKLRTLNLCGSSVSLEPVKAVLTRCPNLHSINLQSCRALPRGIKRLYTGSAVAELRDSLQDKPKTVVSENDTNVEQLNVQQAIVSN